MKDKAYYIEKAKRQRGLTDEQIDFFLQNHPRWDLLPYYARYVKKLGMQGALEQVRAEFDNVDRWTGETLVPGKPELCAGNVERGGYCCDECDHFLKCFPECDPDFRADRHEAFFHAMMETYPGTLLSETEQAFLDAFQRYYDASPEDVEWARKQLRRKREHHLSDEVLDEIADLATLASEEAEG